jgi:histidinol-phosphate aminotransferase
MTLAGRRTGGLRRYRPGGAAPGPDGAKLSSNEHPLGPAPAVRDAMAGAVPHRYPDSGALRAELAAAEGVDLEQVVVTSGSDELCYLVAALFVSEGTPVVLGDPCYRIDEVVTRLLGGEPRLVALRSDGAHDTDAMALAASDAGLLWLPNPHNPTGVAVAPGEVDALLASVPPSCLVVLDEAYHDFLDPAERPDVPALLAAHPNLLVQRTFSKAHALAGLRVGYGLGHPDVIAALETVRPPFNVNAAALAAASAALREPAWRDFGVELVRREREALQALLAELGWRHHRSSANFVAVRPPDPARLGGALAAAGIAVRPGDDLGVPGWLRISIGDPAAMAVVRAVVREEAAR